MDWSTMREFDEPNGETMDKWKSKDFGMDNKVPKKEKIGDGIGIVDFGSTEKEEPLYVNDWNDLKQFDDDHDREWFIEEEKRLSKEYGGNFVKVKYTTQGRVGYYCELCMSEMNAKKSLDLHCNGMKHLKKKNIFLEDGQKPDIHDARSKTKENVNLRKIIDSWGPGHQTRDIPKPKRQKLEPLMATPTYNPGYEPRRDSPERTTRSNFPEDRVFDGGRFNAPQRAPYCPRPNLPEPAPFSHKSSTPTQSGSPLLRAPSPVKQNLSLSPAGAMLQKLAECCVKNGEDAELALNVVVALTKSLKDYNDKKGEKKVAELFLAAEIKLNTVKALESGLKLLGSQRSSTNTPRQPPDDSESRYSFSGTTPSFANERYSNRY